MKASLIWESIRHKNPKPSWTSIVWFKIYVPRFSFIAWLACQFRLSTKDRISSYAPDVDTTCALCSNALEDHNHLFFSCSYSSQIVSIVFAKAGCSTFPLHWNDAVLFLENYNGARVVKEFMKLLFTTTLYRIWFARNRLLHDDHLIPANVNAREIIALVKARLVSFSKFRLKAANFHVLRDWL